MARATKIKEQNQTLTTELEVRIPSINLRNMRMTLVGTSPLIMNRWSEKAKKQILDKQMKQAKQGKEAKNPEQDYRNSIYHMPEGGYGFPTIAFKAAAVSACRFSDGTKMTFARGAFHIDGEYAQIVGEPSPREDMVKIGMGIADIRYRGEFQDWKAILNITYNANALSEEQIVGLFNLAGFGVGVGEWRPEKNGQFGRFKVESIEAMV